MILLQTNQCFVIIGYQQFSPFITLKTDSNHTVTFNGNVSIQESSLRKAFDQLKVIFNHG